MKNTRKILKCRKKSTFFAEILVLSENRRTFAPLEPTKPLHNAQIGGSFFLYKGMLAHYSEPSLSAAQMIQKLQSDGLQFTDTKRAERYMQTIGYFRLKAYMHPFLLTPKSAHHFKPDTYFDYVLLLYRFDKKLRLLIFNELEKIEVALRCAIVNTVTDNSGSIFWMTEAQHFSSSARYEQSITLIRKELSATREDFVVNFRRTYADPFPPSWIVAEILPLGILTNIFTNLKSTSLQKAVAQSFALPLPVFISWLTTITLMRNACCHHARVWNKDNSITPSIPKHITKPWVSIIPNPNRVYYNLCIIRYLLNIISPNNDMTVKLQSLLAAFPAIDISAMGFPANWLSEDLWQ